MCIGPANTVPRGSEPDEKFSYRLNALSGPSGAQSQTDRLWANRMGGLDDEAQRGALSADGRHAFLIDVPLDSHDPLDQLFGSWWASGYVHVDRNELIAPLDAGVRVKDSARAGASAHRDHPLGLGHLLIDLLENGEHLDPDAASDNHQVRLARAEPHDLGTKPGQIEATARGRHQFDATARGRKRHGPQARTPGPIDHTAQLRRQH